MMDHYSVVAFPATSLTRILRERVWVANGVVEGTSLRVSVRWLVYNTIGDNREVEGMGTWPWKYYRYDALCMFVGMTMTM